MSFPSCCRSCNSWCEFEDIWEGKVEIHCEMRVEGFPNKITCEFFEPCPVFFVDVGGERHEFYSPDTQQDQGFTKT